LPENLLEEFEKKKPWYYLHLFIRKFEFGEPTLGTLGSKVNRFPKVPKILGPLKPPIN